MWFWDAVPSAGPYADNLHLAPERYHTNTLTFNFYRPDALSSAQPTKNSVKALTANRKVKVR